MRIAFSYTGIFLVGFLGGVLINRPAITPQLILTGVAMTVFVFLFVLRSEK